MFGFGLGLACGWLVQDWFRGGAGMVYVWSPSGRRDRLQARPGVVQRRRWLVTATVARPICGRKKFSRRRQHCDRRWSSTLQCGSPTWPIGWHCTSARQNLHACTPSVILPSSSSAINALRRKSRLALPLFKQNRKSTKNTPISLRSGIVFGKLYWRLQGEENDVVRNATSFSSFSNFQNN